MHAVRRRRGYYSAYIPLSNKIYKKTMRGKGQKTLESGKKKFTLIHEKNLFNKLSDESITPRLYFEENKFEKIELISNIFFLIITN